MLSFIEEIEKAEHYLNLKAHPGRGKLLALGIGLTVGAVTILLPKVVSANPNLGCATHLEKVQYSAAFQIKNAEFPSSEPLRLVVGIPSGPQSNPPITAQIWSGTTCQAFCETGALEKEGEFNPIALDMTCKSAGLLGFSAHATLLWGRGRTQSKVPTLRLGTWMEGYEQAALRVEVDQYSFPPIPRRLPSRSPSLASSQRREYTLRHAKAN